MLARNVAESLKHFVDDDSMIDDMTRRVEDDPELEAAIADIDDVQSLTQIVFNDSRVQKVLFDLVAKIGRAHV